MLRLGLPKLFSNNSECGHPYLVPDFRGQAFSSLPLIKMFALLDRRTGKKTLVNLKDQINLCPEWLRVIYKIRVDAETL